MLRHVKQLLGARKFLFRPICLDIANEPRVRIGYNTLNRVALKVAFIVVIIINANYYDTMTAIATTAKIDFYRAGFRKNCFRGNKHSNARVCAHITDGRGHTYEHKGIRRMLGENKKTPSWWRFSRWRRKSTRRNSVIEREREKLRLRLVFILCCRHRVICATACSWILKARLVQRRNNNNNSSNNNYNNKNNIIISFVERFLTPLVLRRLSPMRRCTPRRHKPVVGVCERRTREREHAMEEIQNRRNRETEKKRN